MNILRGQSVCPFPLSTEEDKCIWLGNSLNVESNR